MATYAFYVLGPVPTLSYFKAEYQADASGQKRLMPGQEATLYGTNFYDVVSVYLSDVNPYPVDADAGQIETTAVPTERHDITSYTVGKDFTSLTVTMPSVVPEEGYMVVECRAGGCSLKYKATPDAPIIADLSSEMPIPGETVTIYGTHFVFVNEVVIGEGEMVIPEEDLTVSDSQDWIKFTLPKRPTSANTLTVVTDGGEDTISFYDTRYMITDFDSWPGAWMWGGQHVTQDDAQYAPAHTSGNYHGIEGEPGAWNWWFGQLIFGNFELPSAIPDDTPTESVELRFECYLGEPIDEAKMKIWLSEDEVTCLDAIQVTDHISGSTEVGRWMTVAYPLSSFTTLQTYGEYRKVFNGALSHIVWNPSDISTTKIRMYVDNYRLYVRK